MKKINIIVCLLALVCLMPLSVNALIIAESTVISLSEFEAMTGETDGDGSGYRVASAGDVNGDGYDDILIGAYKTGINDNGAVYLIYGDGTPLSSISLVDADAKFTGENSSDYAGISVASAGDVNNDGYDDILIGAYQNNAGGYNAGAVYLIYGQASYLSDINLSAADVKFTGLAADYAGYSVSSAGDVNNDGFDDILIGAYGNSSFLVNAGGAYVVYGQSGDLSDMVLSSADVKYYGESNNDFAGYSVASAGDVNSDGYDDILIGATGDDTVATDAGAVYLIYGAQSLSSDTLNSADAKFAGEGENDGTSFSLAGNGDLNNDGYSDFIIGTYLDYSDSYAGAAYIIYGQSAKLVDKNLSLADAKIVGEAISDNSAFSMAIVGDVNGDDYDDVLIGAVTTTTGGITSNGASYLIYGRSENLTDSALSSANIKFVGTDANQYSGVMVAGAGDTNNDGFADILVGAVGDWGNPDAGTAYLGYVFLDEDGDGLAGDGGLVVGTDLNDDDYDNDGVPADEDCDDADDAISEEQDYYTDADGDGLGDGDLPTTAICSSTAPDGYSANNYDNDDEIADGGIEIPGDEIDNDGDSEVDEDNNLAENGTHPYYGSLDPSSEADFALAVKSVKASGKGKIRVVYNDDSAYKYQIFSFSKKTKVKIKKYSAAYYLVLQPQGKKIAMVNVLTGQVVNRKTLNKKTSKYTNLKTIKLRESTWALVTQKNKAGKVKISLTKILPAKHKLGKVAQKTLVNSAVNVSKTKKAKKANTLLLRSKKNKTLEKLYLTKKTKLILK
ncbi:MAG: integrin alpha [Patescibacteria group bacterium]